MLKPKVLSVLFALLASVALHAGAATVYTAVLDGPSENPFNPSLGTGFARVTFDDDLNTMRVEASFSGLSSTTTASHIHCCVAPPGLASVATQTPSFIGFPLGVTSGLFDSTFDLTLASTYRAGFITSSGGTPADAQAALFAGLNAGQAYFNIHTNTSPTGEIRGFLVAIPEPETYALMLAGLGMLGVVARRRKQKATA